MSESSEDRDLLAGEYVLGVLDPAEALAAAERVAHDADFAALVAAWEQRLAPLARLVPPVAPPAELWARVEQSIGPAETAAPVQIGAFRRAWRNAGLWRGTTAAALALAAAFAGLLFTRAPVPAPRLVAALAPQGAPAPVFLAEQLSDGRILLRPLAPVSVSADKDLELWALPAGAKKPVALGVLPSSGRSMQASGLMLANTRLMISLEPQGGSPTGLPTGPVVYTGTLTGAR